ncbi:hypothetical protein GQ53DRAFT_740507 [Thozetella sp. PMI_491]|nr:hypothetical protein GQ53DRAFT_740507 [Thozetella sp. PMI_491]
MPFFDKLSSEKATADAPSYSEQATDLAPPPPYAGTSAEGSTVVRAATHFPPELNGYFSWKSMRTFYLGPSAEEKMFAVEQHSGGLTGKKPQIILFGGLTNKDPMLATGACDNWKQTRFSIKVQAREGKHGDFEVLMNSGNLGTKYQLSIPTGEKGGEPEQFEWRSSHGEELKQLSKGHRAWGWKLVRLGGPNVKPGGAETALREVGYTSDGREVVAILALNTTASMTKSFRFAFAGSALTGTLGEAWETAALTSGLQVLNIYHQGQTAATSAASS